MHLQLRHRPKLGYVGLWVAAFTSWIGLPGPGEAALVTAGTFAGRDRLDLASVLFAAWTGSQLGGVAGWLVGLRGGRAVATARGPLLHAREAALDKGERFYERFGTLAVFLTPSWVAGTTGMSWKRYLPANAVASLVWTLLFGLGAYFVGPSVAELATDLGFVGVAVVIVLAIVAAVAARRAHRRRAAAAARRR